MNQFIITFLFSICFAVNASSQVLSLNSAFTSEWEVLNEQAEKIKDNLPKINIPQFAAYATCF